MQKLVSRSIAILVLIAGLFTIRELWPVIFEWGKGELYSTPDWILLCIALAVVISLLFLFVGWLLRGTPVDATTLNRIRRFMGD